MQMGHTRGLAYPEHRFPPHERSQDINGGGHASTNIAFIDSGAQVSSQPGWSDPVPITTGTNSHVHPTIANGEYWMHSQEEMLAFSRNGKDVGVLRTTGNGAAWSDSATWITADSADNDFPSLVHSNTNQPANETAMLVWQSRRNGNLDICYSTYAQMTWSSPQPIDTSLEDDIVPNVVQLPYTYTCVWERRGSILYSQYDSTGWSTPFLLSLPGDTLNRLPQVGLTPFGYQPLVVWEQKKSRDTTRSVMYTFRNGTTWTTPDTLVDAGDNRRPRFFKYGYMSVVFWEQRTRSASFCRSGIANISNGRCELQDISPLTYYPDEQQNGSVNGYMIITANESRLFSWYAVAAWEAVATDPESIGVSIGPFSLPIERLSGTGARTNRNPDVSQGTLIGNGVRFWVLWEARVGGAWQLYGSNTIVIIDDVEEPGRPSEEFALEQNYPNPFNPTTTISFTIPHSSFTVLRVYDVLGREVAALVNEEMSPGRYERILDARNLASGVYLYRLRAGPSTQTRKLVVMK